MKSAMAVSMPLTGTCGYISNWSNILRPEPSPRNELRIKRLIHPAVSCPVLEKQFHLLF